MKLQRCPWVAADPDMLRYHDEEWGRPSHDERHLFEMLVLEGAQAGLSWSTILHKRAAYRRAFDGFDPARVARFDEDRLRALLADRGIVRNRLKLESAINNARAVLELRETGEGLDTFLWSFVDGVPRQNRWRRLEQIPATTPESEAMSKALKRRGFSFVGSTVCYAFMQAVGMVNDHLVTCPWHARVQQQK
ncbi:MAG: DNA-3-methyladenine glycosylase I [Thiohalomonadaceae bacterium]